MLRCRHACKLGILIFVLVLALLLVYLVASSIVAIVVGVGLDCKAREREPPMAVTGVTGLIGRSDVGLVGVRVAVRRR